MPCQKLESEMRSDINDKTILILKIHPLKLKIFLSGNAKEQYNVMNCRKNVRDDRKREYESEIITRNKQRNGIRKDGEYEKREYNETKLKKRYEKQRK
jgi:hypothetical protein